MHRSRSPLLHRLLLPAILTVTALVVAVLPATPATADPTDVCSTSDRYQLLLDPSGVANQALCHVQEQTLQRLSEDQWGLPYTSEQRNRMLRWGRQASLGAMYLQLLAIAQKSPSARTSDEAAVYTWLQQTLAALRSQLANGAYAEQIEWSHDPCNYVPPVPGAQASGCSDPDSLTTLFGQPPGPTYEQFVSYGAQRVLTEDFDADDLAMVAATARSAQHQLIGAVAGVGAGLVISGALVAAATAGLAFSTALTAGATATASATVAAAGTAGLGALVAGVAASIFFVVIAVTTAVVRGVQVFDQAKIPDQLRTDIADAAKPVDIVNWIGNDSSRAGLLLQAIARRINPGAPPSAPVPASPATDAPGFLVTSGFSEVAFTQTLRFRSPVDPEAYYDAWLDDGWWVIRDDDGGLAMSHDLVYLDHDGFTRSASRTTDGFLITTVGAVSPDASCTPVNGCEQSDALQILTPPPTPTNPLKSTATLVETPIAFTTLPSIGSSYAVGDELDATVEAEATHLTTMSYRWELTRHDPTGDQIARMDGAEIKRTFTIPGDYGLTAIATASSGETIKHEWDFTVSGEAAGQFASGILLTQYPENGATPDDEPGPWVEGSTSGTICLSTEGTDPTDFSLQFVGEAAQAADGVTTGYACFSRPASAKKAGVHLLENVSACKVSALCVQTTAIEYIDGQWVQRSPFSYTITNQPPSATDVSQGLSGGTLAVTVPSEPSTFTVGQTVQARTTVTDAGGGLLTVHVRWSDGFGETLTDIPSGQVIDVTHTYEEVSWGPVGVQFQAVDDSGETGNLATGFFFVKPRPAQIELDASSDPTGLVTVTGQYTDPDHTASLLALDWGDGTHDVYDAPFPLPLDTEYASAADVQDRFTATHRYDSGGTHHLTAYIVNGAAVDGVRNASVTVPNAAPVVVSDGPITVSDDGDVDFDAMVGDLNIDDTLTFHVDFGDGDIDFRTGRHSGDTVHVHHKYANGRYTVTLTATDGDDAESEALTRCVFVGRDVAAEPCPGVLPASDDDLESTPPGDVSGPEQAAPGSAITMSVGSIAGAGDVVSGWIYSTPTSLGFATVTSGGTVTFTIPDSIATGSHTIVLSLGATLLGWFPITLAATGDDSGGSGGSGGSGDDSGSGGSGGDSGGGSGDSSGSSEGGSSEGGSGDDGSTTGGLAGTGSDPSIAFLAALLLLAAGGATAGIGARRRTRRAGR